MRILLIVLLGFKMSSAALAQSYSLVNTSNSPHAKMSGVDMGAVHLTKGFWAERFEICKDSMLPHLWRIYTDPTIAHAFTNFRIAAGLDTGSHQGPPFHDGDFYKLLEAMAGAYAVSKDPAIDSLMDMAIAVIAKSQRPDGYIHTPVMIEERKNSDNVKAFEDRLNFETYNMGHLMTAACVHYHATGKKNFLKLAIAAADHLANFYKRASPELARNAICPSHYMGIVELYRTTKDTGYLRLAKSLIDIRGLVDDGTDDNQDRVPFRSQTSASGHAVRANYLYAGVADLYAETGEDSLLYCLNSIWDDIVSHKIYITGGCGALYDGVSPDAVSYSPPYIQQVHQAYGRDYQLPNTTAHNETCANIGNVLFNWRMLLVTGQPKYADIIEQTLYNSVLSGVSLDGDRYFYTNPLRAARELPYHMRWAGGREEYIRLSNCCPPNVARTIAEVSDYMYSISPQGLYFNLYGGNTLDTKLADGSILRLTQVTEYPWDGRISIRIAEAPQQPFSIFLRIPGWCGNATVSINGKSETCRTGAYKTLTRTWKKGDIIELTLPMNVSLTESNPMVEETRNQTAVSRGPVVYCLESPDLPATTALTTIGIPTNIQLTPKPAHIGHSHFIALEGMAERTGTGNWKQSLYRSVGQNRPKATPIKLIPYYAWANRGASDMSVWLPLMR